MKTKLTKKSSSLVVLIVALFVGIFAVNSAWAYFTDNQRDDNKITLKAINTEIEEEIVEADLTKIPTIKNTGKSDCIIRLKVTVTPDSEKENIEFRELDEKNWLFNESDGFFYYQGVVAPKKSTTAIFTGVDILDKEIMNDFDIILYQEAIQSEIYDDEGIKINVLTDGLYDQTKADKIWALYDAQ